MSDVDAACALLLAAAGVGTLVYFFVKEESDPATPPFALLVCVLASALSVCASREWRRVDAGFKDVPFRPDGRAFCIWVLLIYPASLGSAGTQVYWCLQDESDCPAAKRRTVLYLFAAAWLCTAAWPFAFGARRYYLSALLLFATASLSMTALSTLGAWQGQAEEWERWGIAFPCALLSSWTSVAFLIGASIAIEAPATAQGSADAEEEQTLKPVDAKTEKPAASPEVNSAAAGAAATLIASTVGIASTILPDPVIPLVAAWAVAFMTRASVLQRVACCISLSAVCAMVLLRVYKVDV